MKIKGNLVKFDVPNTLQYAISKDCKIDIPDKLPIVCEFDRSHTIGFASVSRTDEGLVFKGEVVSPCIDEYFEKQMRDSQAESEEK